MTFQKLIPYLNDRHFHPDKEVTNGKITALTLVCATLHQKEVKLPVLERILEGTGYRATYFPNISEIHITKSK